jgi:sterol desaturase/sphingolipid hydroxylase (fatty acid hydroxylase superfamily)
MRPETLFLLGVWAIYVVFEIYQKKFFMKPGEKPSDAPVEIITAVILLFFMQPFVVASGYSITGQLFPEAQDIIADWHFLAIFGLLLVFDDLTQYWWHRTVHNVPFLYHLHRPHHEAEYLSVRIVYRNNPLYYLFMPSLWLSGSLLYLGSGWVYVVYICMKMTVIYGAHSDIRWDKNLYKIKWLSPLMWIVERTISTPATHFAHHGKYKTDPNTNYKGNYGNFLFFWDVLFGTAVITRDYPKEYGVENLNEASFGYQVFWPLIQENKKQQ